MTAAQTTRHEEGTDTQKVCDVVNASAVKHCKHDKPIEQCQQARLVNLK